MGSIEQSKALGNILFAVIIRSCFLFDALNVSIDEITVIFMLYMYIKVYQRSKTQYRES